MASGKTLIGNELANKLNYEFVDLDEFIEDNVKIEISRIFETRGELFFRKMESESLKELIQTKDNFVLALGGGTPCYGNNIDLINNSDKTLSIYLETSLPVLVERLLIEKNYRPLVSHITNENDMREFVGKHLFERSQFYNQADHSIITSNKAVKKIVEEIILMLF